MSDWIKEVTSKEDFEEIVNSADRVVVDFWATWCGPCKGFKPHFDAAADAAAIQSNILGRTTFVTVDVDKAPELVQEFGVMAVPTVLLIDKETVTPVKSRTAVTLLKEISS